MGLMSPYNCQRVRHVTTSHEWVLGYVRPKSRARCRADNVHNALKFGRILAHPLGRASSRCNAR